MTTILLTGNPHVGKSAIADITQREMTKHYNKSVDIISVGALVEKIAQEYIPKGELQFMEIWLQEPYRREAIRRASIQLKNSEADHQIIEMPLSMYYRQGKVLNAIFDQFDIQQLHHSRQIDFMITLLGDPKTAADNYKDSPFPTDIPTILDWSSCEVNNAKIIMPYDLDNTNGFQREYSPQRLVMPRPFSDLSLVKLLADPDPVIIYLAGPITKLYPNKDDSPDIIAQKEADIVKKAELRDRLQQYAIILVPLELQDLITDPKAVEYTVIRDLEWFITLSADMTVAHYPGIYTSDGTFVEETHTGKVGKPLIKVHPGYDEQVFSPKLRKPLFINEASFFDSLNDINEGDPNYLTRMLTPDFSAPRYAHLYQE